MAYAFKKTMVISCGDVAVNVQVKGLVRVKSPR